MNRDRKVSLEEREGVSATEVADTPSSFGVASAETLRELEFAAALDAVAEHAVSGLGARSVRDRRPSNSMEWITAELASVAELDALLGEGDEFRPEHVEDIHATIETLELPGSVLEPSDLIHARGALAAMHAVRQELLRVEEDAPLVAALVAEIPPASLERNINRALESDGTVKDGASPQLATARRRLRETRAQLRSLLERTLRSVGADAQGDVTVRGGRYVIPLRRDSRSGVRGIVHGESGSGATLFIEPAEAVELGNEVNGWEAEEARAIIAVLRDLTDDLRPHSSLLLAGIEMCVAVDDLYSRTRYLQEVRGVVPALADGGTTFRVIAGKHPLLMSESGEPVPFTLELSEEERTVLVSGPNAGGKTVLLKAVGLASALAQAGVVPPVEKGTTLPVFDHIFVDIGDHQSIAASLSTYSAHLSTIRGILERADSKSLVLLDEMGGGTDPVEGTALAGAVLQSLNDRGCITIATTHLSGLKELAARTNGMANASFHFDVDTLAPTYRFVKDIPGRSYGLAIARRLGLSEEVLLRADELLPEAARSLESILADLEVREEALTERELVASGEAARLETESRKAREQAESLDMREIAVSEREIEIEREGRQQARKYLLDARRRVEEALGVARGATRDITAKQARKMVEEGVSDEGEALRRLEKQAEKLGWRIKGRGSTGTESSGKGKGKGKGEGGKGKEAASVGRKTASPLPSLDSFDLATESAASDIDLRGKNGDEAEAELVFALDGAIAGDLPWLRIIHGKGTGALRARVAEVLKLDSRVSSFRLAPPQQGGSGVTIVEFRK